MPQAPGWARGDTFPAVTSGTGASINVTVPSDVVDGDFLILALSHKSGGFATVPAAWTLLAQDTTGTVWVELYYRRASGEPGSYTITGLGTISLGVIRRYLGGLLAGNPANALSARIVIGGGTRHRFTGLTTTTDACLLISLLGSDRNTSTVLVQSRVDPDLSQSPAVDPALAQWNSQALGTSGSGGGCTLALHAAMQPTMGFTGEGRGTNIVGSILTGDTVGLWVALIPEPAGAPSGATRYYPTIGVPDALLEWFNWGGWFTSATGPRGYDLSEPTHLLSQQKSLGGDLTLLNATSNQIAAFLYWRGVTPKLAAQTVSGTVDLCQFRLAQHTTLGATSARQKVHIYAVNDDGINFTIAGTLLDNHVDSVDFPPTVVGWKQLAAPAALTPVNIPEGGRIVVEYGADILSAPTPAPTRPPSAWVNLRGAIGTTVSEWVGSIVRSCGLAWPDAVDGDSGITTRCPWIEFSQTILEQAPAAVPLVNQTCVLATIIPSVPFTDTVDTSIATSPMREVWYQWTAPTAGRAFIHTPYTTYQTEIAVFESCADALGNGLFGSALQTTDRITTGSGSSHAVDSLTVYQLNAQAGKTYRIRIRETLDAGNAPLGGLLTVGVQYVTPLAANDVFVAAQGLLVRYTSAGLLADKVLGHATIPVYSGLAIDYTERALTNTVDASTHTGHRLLVAAFSADVVEIRDLATLGVGNGPLDTIDFSSIGQNISALATNAAGQVYAGFFGNGFTLVAGQGSSYLFSAADASSAPIAVTDAIFGAGQPGAPFPAPTLFTPAVEVGGTNYLDFTPDGNQLFYTSGGWYQPIGGVLLRALDAVSGTLVETRTVPAPPDPGVNQGLKGHQPLGDGTVLVCNGTAISRVDATGTILQNFVVPPTFPGQSFSDYGFSFADIEIQEDGEFFWVVDEASLRLFKFSLTTGLLVLTVATGLGYGTVTSMVIYRPNGVEPPIPPVVPTAACPVALGPAPVAPPAACAVNLVPSAV